MSMKNKYVSAMIIDGTQNDPTIISLDNARIVFNFDEEGNPILTNSILIKELLWWYMEHHWKNTLTFGQDGFGLLTGYW